MRFAFSDREAVAFVEKVFSSERRAGPVWDGRQLPEMEVISNTRDTTASVRAIIKYEGKTGRTLTAFLYADCEVGWSN